MWPPDPGEGILIKLVYGLWCRCQEPPLVEWQRGGIDFLFCDIKTTRACLTRTWPDYSKPGPLSHTRYELTFHKLLDGKVSPAEVVIRSEISDTHSRYLKALWRDVSVTADAVPESLERIAKDLQVDL